ncbi:MAG: (Fe-S)-binding protein [SAR324 cluster bacterium]|nr:(Fe-S)-binding protein [SAR324 cluster bacterium]
MNTAVSQSELNAAWRGAESHCIKCGFCLPVCPTYRETGSEASSPRGRLELMYAAAQGQLPAREIAEPLGQCLGCLACETACPAGIRFRDLLEAGQADTARGGALKHLLLNRLLLSPGLRSLLAWGLYAYRMSGLQFVLRGLGLLDLLLPSLGRMERAIPPFGPPLGWRRGVRGLIAEISTPAREGAEAVLFTGCVMDTLFGEVHAATVKVLARNGYKALLPPGQTCCGALHAHEGQREAARELARRNIAAWEATGEAPIVVNSAGCGATLKAYGRLLAGDEQWRERAERVAARVRDVCEFLAALPLVQPTRPMPMRVAYDDPCHLLHAQQISSQPRELLARIPELELVPLPEADWCCGSAGSYSLHYPAMSARVLARKMANIAATEAHVVATGNPGCLLQLRLGAKRQGLQIHVVHPIQLLARSYE